MEKSKEGSKCVGTRTHKRKSKDLIQPRKDSNTKIRIRVKRKIQKTDRRIRGIDQNTSLSIPPFVNEDTKKQTKKVTMTVNGTPTPNKCVSLNTQFSFCLGLVPHKVPRRSIHHLKNALTPETTQGLDKLARRIEDPTTKSLDEISSKTTKRPQNA